MSPLTTRFFRWLAGLLVRGPGAPFVLGDLEEAMRRDVERGVLPWRARRRYLANLVASALRLARERIRLRPSGTPSFGISWLDVRLGLRMLTKHPLLTAVSVISLGIGIPVGLAPGYLADALEAPLPVEEGERIRVLRYHNLEPPGDVTTTSYDYRVFRETLAAFEELGAAREVESGLSSVAGAGAAVPAAEVSASAFSILRVAPLLGRTLALSDEAPGAAPVVILGYDVWESRFVGDPEVVGRTVRVDGAPHTVIGIMPRRFLFPMHASMWLPLKERAAAEPGAGPSLRIFGRLASGVTAEAARSELTSVVRGMAREAPERYGRVEAEVVRYAVGAMGFPRGGLRTIAGWWLVETGAILLLVVACVNVGLLIFARTADRTSEMAVRTALGASRTRIVGQILAETLVMAVLAAGLGLLLIDGLSDHLLPAMWSPAWGGMPWWFDFGVTGRTAVQAIALAAFSAVVAAVLPALRVTGRRVQQSIQRAGAARSDVRFGGLSSVLVAADVALAVAGVGLVTGIVALMGNVVGAPELQGLPTEEYLAVQVTLPTALHGSEADTLDGSAREAELAAFQRELVERLEREPGVRAVAVAARLPRMDHRSRMVEVDGGERPTGYPVADVAPGFFEALGQPILAGRAFHAGDLEGDRLAVIVNTGFVERALGGRSAVGRRLRYLSYPDREPGPWQEIVGVVPALGMNLIEPEEAGAGIYHPAAPGEIDPLWLALHVGPETGAFVPRVRELVGDVDATAVISRATALDDVFPEDWYLLVGMVFGWSLFVGVLLALAASGIYAIMAFTVAQRTREIGIRAALGARAGDIVTTVGRRSAIQLVAGTLLGMPLAGGIYALVRQDPTLDRSALLVAVAPGVAVLLVVGLLACTVPLRRALRIAPTEAMRGEG